MQDFIMIYWEKKSRDISIFNVLFLFVFRKHYAWVSSEFVSFVRFYIQNDWPCINDVV